MKSHIMGYIYKKTYSYFLFCISIFGVLSLQAQDLTISTGGQTGTSGTNWSIVGNELLVASSGSATVHPSVITDHLTNTGDLVVRLPWLSGTPRNININGSIQYTGATPRTLTFRAANNISLASGVQITSSNAALNLVLNTIFGTAGSPNNGSVLLSNSPVITTNGGHIWVGGGSTASSTWNGLTVGDGTANTWTPGTNGISIVGASITTNGGSVQFSGLAFPSSGAGISYGVYIDNSTITTEAGNIAVDGTIRGVYNQGAGAILHGNTGLVSLTTTSGTISIQGSGYDDGTSASWRIGGYLWGQNHAVTLSSQSGNIEVDGNAQFTSTTNDKEGIVITGTATDRARIISRSGNITLNGTNTRQGDGQYCNSIRFTASNASNAIRIGSDGTNSYSGNILIEGNSIYQRNNNAGSGSVSVQSSGTLTIQPTGTTFTHMRAGDAGTLSFDDDWNFGTSLSGFTLGKTTNNSNVTFANNLTTSGPITAYGGSITLNSNVKLEATAGNILLDADLGTALAQSSHGISLGAGSTLKTNTSGNITMLGRSGTGACSGPSCRGIYASTIATLDAAGNIELTGLSFTSGASGRGIDLFGVGLSAGGSISMTGQHSTGASFAVALEMSGTTPSTLSAGSGITLESLNNTSGTVYMANGATLNGGSGDIEIKAAVIQTSAVSRDITTTGQIRLLPDADQTSFAAALNTQYLNFVSATGLTIGADGNTGNITLGRSHTIAGPISIYGGVVTLSASTNLTQSATGDIFIKAITGSATSITNSATITKSGGTGTLTLQGHGRVINNGTITTSGTGVLNVILWSDFDNSNNDGGVSINASSPISTNGGHVWLGGSNSNGGSYTWNGLTVGDGPSIGTATFNTNALDLNGNITTNGGDFLAWAGAGGGGVNGIGTTSLEKNINTGSGDIVLITNAIDGTGGISIIFNGTGKFYLVPNGGNFGATLDWNPAITGSTLGLNFPGVYNYLLIDNFASLTGLTIGRYNEMLSGSTPVVLTNSSNVTISTATSISGPIELYGGAIALNANLTTTNTSTGDVLVDGTTVSGSGNLLLAAGRTATINVTSASTYAGVISGSGSGFTKLGTGLLTLTNDQTYTGTTTISAGDLQVGSGGSVSQASSGSLAAASPVVVAAGSELILAPNENLTFANAVSGAGAVEVKGMSGRYYNAFLTGAAATIATNSTVLEVLTRITGGLQWGASVFTGGVSRACAAYVKVYNAATNTATLQFQQWDGQYTKVVFAQLTQSGTNVQIRANTSVYGTGAAFREANVLGQDMSTGGSAMPLATTSSASGYGIAEVYMSGKVNFTGTLSYSGATILSNTVTNITSPNTYSYTSRGTQEITDASSSFPSGSAVANNGLIVFNRSTALTISNDLSGTEELLQVGADITLTGTNTYSGATTIDLNKTLNIGAGGTTGSLTGNIVNYGTLMFNRSDASSYPGIISGTGTLTKSGSGDLTMTGLNTYTGATTISAGRLILERNIPATSSSGFSGDGTLVIQPSSASFTNAVTYPISGFTVSSSIGGLVVGKLGNTATITVASATSAAGPITFFGGTLNVNENIAATNNGNISLYANTLNFGSGKTVASGGELLVAPSSVANTIGVAGSSGSLLIPDSYFTTNFANGFTNITIGSADQTGNIVTRQVTLRSDITFRTTGSLTLENAPFDIGTRTLTLGSSMTVLGMPTNFIRTSSTGVVRRSIGIAGSGLFPIGNSTYNPLTITNNNGSADDFTARVADAVLDGGTSGTAITDKVVNRTWHIGKTAANASSGVDLTFQWEANQELGTMPDYKLSHFGTFWAPVTGTSGSVSDNSGVKTMTHTGYTGSFSPFAIGSSTGALPVSWVDFTATRAGQTIELNWRTGSEQNTKDFVVQHSTGNGSWKNIGNVAAAGFSSSVRSYSFTHTQPVDGRNLYRLLQRDLDGKESLSKVVSVVMPSATSVQVYPVPSTNGSVFVKLPADQVLKVFNSTGVLMLEQQGKAGVQSFDLQSLPKGLYYLQAGKETVRVMLQ